MTTKANTSLIYLPIEGVDREHCALVVDKGLKNVSKLTNY